MMVNLSPTDESYFESLCTLRFAKAVNQCELGRPRRHMQMGDGPAASSGAGSGGGASSASTSSSRLMAGTASSTGRSGRPK